MRMLAVSTVSLALAAALAAPASAAPTRAHATHHPVATAPVCAYNAEPAEQARVVDAAMDSIAHLRADRGFDYAADVLSHAKAILIVPHMVKAGFIIGGEGGDGVVLVRQGIHWSNPAFYSMGAATFGLQAGIEGAGTGHVRDERPRAREHHARRFQDRLDSRPCDSHVGSNAHSTNSGYGDIVVWSKAQGAFAGIYRERIGNSPPSRMGCGLVWPSCHG